MTLVDTELRFNELFAWIWVGFTFAFGPALLAAGLLPNKFDCRDISSRFPTLKFGHVLGFICRLA